ncbi:hypothetical protein [Agrobacterium vitis]|uniref:hypothetical protein n=1 Tax=Agrobacterium vitis TaxID=373 RepID=UPI003D277013
MKRLWRVIGISATAMHRDWVPPDISRLFLKWVEPMKRAADCFYRIGVRLQGVEADNVLNLAGVTTYAAGLLRIATLADVWRLPVLVGRLGMASCGAAGRVMLP